MDDALKASVSAGERALTALTDLLRSGVDPQAKVSPEWTVRDVACHIAGGLSDYGVIADGLGSPLVSLDQLSAWNDATIAAVETHDLATLADAIDAGSAALWAGMRETEGDPVVPWHAGVPLRLSVVAAMMIGEGYVHGRDVARACGRRWRIPEEDARTGLVAVLPVLSEFVDPEGAAGVRARIEVHLRGVSQRWLLEFDDGWLTVGDPDGRGVDCTISARAVPFLLVSYGRMSPLRSSLDLGVAAWGLRPWLAFRLPGMLRNP